MSVAQLYDDGKVFYERLGRYIKVRRIINEHEFLFIVEETRPASQHACSIEDIEAVLKELPVEEYGELKFIILRQPKRKEEVLHPVWGRLIYSYEFEGNYYPAIILDSVASDKTFKWTKRLSVEAQKELVRLQEDGHTVADTGKFYEIKFDPAAVRNTQLYRTLLHELGHYVHYLNIVERPARNDEEYEEWEKRHDLYSKIPHAEKEQFAHNYANTMKKYLVDRRAIPFERK